MTFGGRMFYFINAATIRKLLKVVIMSLLMGKEWVSNWR
jgi:hypothetical protein